MDEAGSEDLNSIELSDLMALQLSTIESVTIVPSFSIGTLTANDSKVLVPMMSCILHGMFGEEDERRSVSAVLAFDNLAFLAMRLGDALQGALGDIEEVSRGELMPDHDRLSYATQCLSAGSADLAAAADRLRALADRGGQQVTAPLS
jgi:hypothetical protein